MRRTIIIALLAVTFSLTSSATNWSDFIGKPLILYRFGEYQNHWFSRFIGTNPAGAAPVEQLLLTDSTHLEWKYAMTGDFKRECTLQDSVLLLKEPLHDNNHFRIVEYTGEVLLTQGDDGLTRAFFVQHSQPELSMLPVSVGSKKGFCNGELDDLLPAVTDITYSSHTPMGRNFLFHLQPSKEDKAWLQSTKEVFDDATEQIKAFDINLFPHGKPVLADVHQKGVDDCNAMSVLADMAFLYPDFIKSIIHKEAADSFRVDMFDPDGKPIVVCVSNRFPVREGGYPIFCVGEDDKYNWISIMEKAAMKWIKVYNHINVISGCNAEMITPMFTGDGRSFCIQPGRLESKDLARMVNVCLEHGMMVNGGFLKSDIPLDGHKTIAKHGHSFLPPQRKGALYAIRNPWGGGANDHVMNVMSDNTVVPPLIDIRVISPGAAAKFFDKKALHQKIEGLKYDKAEKKEKIKLKKGEVPQLLNYPSADMNSLPLHGGEVMIKGRIIPGGPQIAKQFEGRISALMRNYIAGTEKTTLFEVKEDGTFSLNLQVPYPMYLLVYPIAEVYACPGDTVDITIDITKPTKEEGVTLDGTGLSGEVSKLTKKIRSTYCDFSADYNPSAEKNNPTPDSLLKRKDELVARLDEMICRINAGLPELEGCTPMASDIIHTYIVAAYTEHICDYYMSLDRKGYDTGKIWQKFFSFAAPRERYLFDNPLLLISANHFFFNRIEYSLFNSSSYPISLKLSPTDFSAQVCKLRNLVSWELKNAADKPDYAAEQVAKTFSHITHPEVMRQAVLAYHQHVLDHEVKVIGEKPMTKADSIFQRIIEPYNGNVLYVDFWEMSCGPCRSLMLSMRDEVEANKDKPVKYLYITDDSEEKCRPFLEPNNIKGEHIHVTHAEWGYLQEKFQFSGIPYHFILDKDGKRRDGVTIEELLKEIE